MKWCGGHVKSFCLEKFLFFYLSTAEMNVHMEPGLHPHTYCTGARFDVGDHRCWRSGCVNRGHRSFGVSVGMPPARSIQLPNQES